MGKEKVFNAIKLFFQIIISGCGILFLVFIINFLILRTNTPDKNKAYPPPRIQPYPPPRTNNTPNPVRAISTPFTPIMRDAKDGHILSPTEIAVISTYTFERAQLLTPPPSSKLVQINKSSYPINSITDLPEVVYHDPFYGGAETGLGDCIQTRNPGQAVLVHSLEGDPDYYIVPFFKNNKLCAKAIIEINNGLGYVTALGQGFGDKYPQLNADEAVRQVILKTGKQVVEQPILSFIKCEEVDPFNPFWKVTTTDDQVLYVIFITGISENSTSPETTVTVIMSDEIHLLK